MTSIGSNIASSSGVGSGEGPLAPLKVFLTLEEQLQNFQCMISKCIQCQVIFDAPFFKSVAKVVEAMRMDPCGDIYHLFSHISGYLPLWFQRSTPLHWVVLMDDRVMVRYILSSGKVNINASCKLRNTSALCYAIIGGNHGIVEDLLEYKANVFVDSDFHLLVRQKDSMWGSLKMILADNVNRCDERKKTALHHAAEEGYVEVVTYLLDEEADVNFRNDYESTPLHYAAGKGSLEVVTLLLQQNADVNAVNILGERPLHLAAKEGSTNVVSLLLNHNAVVDAFDNNGMTPLLYSLRGQTVDTSNALIAHGAKVFVDSGAEEGYVDVVTYLLNEEADVNFKNDYESTPLHYAVGKGSLEVVKLLLQKNVDINAVNRHGERPLHLAAKAGTANIVSLLLDHNAVVDAFDKDGMTPLLYSLRGKTVDTSNALIAHSANVNVKDDEGNNALHLAIRAHGSDHNMMARMEFL